jgi:hypothetical protein
MRGWRGLVAFLLGLAACVLVVTGVAALVSDGFSKPNDDFWWVLWATGPPCGVAVGGYVWRKLDYWFPDSYAIHLLETQIEEMKAKLDRPPGRHRKA